MMKCNNGVAGCKWVGVLRMKDRTIKSSEVGFFNPESYEPQPMGDGETGDHNEQCKKGESMSEKDSWDDLSACLEKVKRRVVSRLSRRLKSESLISNAFISSSLGGQSATAREK